jgi:uncharacterized membrane protein YjgN (DUF898 family)
LLEAGVHYLAMHADAGASPAASVEPSFSGDGGRFVRLLIKGGLLQLVTFGFYRFWLLTDIRRHLWSSTSIDGDALEYTGRGRELLIGFLFAVAVLAPLFLVYFLAGIEAERYKAFASFPLYLILFLFGQFAAYRARRYRLTRTVWRGVRFWMSGSGWSYAFRAFLWSAFAYLTGGLAYPWRAAALERYKMRNTYYGDMRGTFVGTGWGLFKKGFWLWLILFCLVAAWIAWIVVMVAQSPETADADGDIDLGAGVARAAIGGGSIIALVFAIAWPLYQAIEWRWWAEGARIGPVEMTSALPRTKILVLYLKTVAWSLVGSLVLGVVFIVFAMSVNGHVNAQLIVRSRYVITGLVVLGYLIVLMAFGIVYRFYMQHQLWRAFVNTVTIHNLEATLSVSARGEAANAFGEGLLDGLDMGGF